MESNVYFDQCMEFLARMIEKYGDKIPIQHPEDTYESEIYSEFCT